MNRKKEQKTGFTLVEVLIFVTILSLFFTVAASVLTVSLRASKLNEHKIFAKHYADELYEWLSSEKEQNWGGYTTDAYLSTFTYRASLSTGEYCFSSSPITDWSSPITTLDDCPYSLRGLFRRYVILTPVTTSGTNTYIDNVKVEIKVEWSELGKTYSVPLKSTFSIWEKTY